MIFCFVKVKVISKLLFEYPKITCFWNAAFDCGVKYTRTQKLRFSNLNAWTEKNCKRFDETYNFRSSIDRIGFFWCLSMQDSKIKILLYFWIQRYRNFSCFQNQSTCWNAFTSLPMPNFPNFLYALQKSFLSILFFRQITDF